MEEFLNLKIFASGLEVMKTGTRYSILFRVSFTVGKEAAKFVMLGNQLHFYVTDLATRTLFIEAFHANIKQTLNISMLHYNFSGDDVNTIQFLI